MKVKYMKVVKYFKVKNSAQEASTNDVTSLGEGEFQKTDKKDGGCWDKNDVIFIDFLRKILNNDLEKLVTLIVIQWHRSDEYLTPFNFLNF